MDLQELDIKDVQSNLWILWIWITVTRGKPGSSKICILKPFLQPCRLPMMWSLRLHCYWQLYCVGIYLQIFTFSSSPVKTFLYLQLALQSAAVLNIQRCLYQKEYGNRDSSQVILDPPAFWCFSKVKYCFKGCSFNAFWFVLSDRLHMTAIHRSYLLLLLFWLQIKCKAQHMVTGLPEGEKKKKQNYVKATKVIWFN